MRGKDVFRVKKSPIDWLKTSTKIAQTPQRTPRRNYGGKRANGRPVVAFGSGNSRDRNRLTKAPVGAPYNSVAVLQQIAKPSVG